MIPAGCVYTRTYIKRKAFFLVHAQWLRYMLYKEHCDGASSLATAPNDEALNEIQVKLIPNVEFV